MDKGRLYKLAASYLGEAECKVGTPVYTALDDVAQQAISLALDYSKWGFALERVTLPLTLQHATLPADCLEIQKCSLSRYEVIGREIYSTGYDMPEEVTLTYKSSALADTVCLPDYAPLFCEGCVLLVAAKAAPRVTNRFDLAVELEQKAYQMLYRAKLKEARSTNSNDQEPNVEY